MSEKKATLVFIPFPILSHQAAAVELAKLLVDRDERLSVTFIIMKLPTDTKVSPYPEIPRMNFIELPQSESNYTEWSKTPKLFLARFMESQKSRVRDAVAEILINESNTNRISGFVIDLLCTVMIDVVNEFGIPSYMYFICGGAASLRLLFHLQSLTDDENQDLMEYENSDVAILVPSFADPVPAKVWPSDVFNKDGGFPYFIRKFRETKGIILNTFLEFEPHAVKSLLDDDKIPPVYPVGPMIQSRGGEISDLNKRKHDEIIEWLDEQPDSSVVFLCFGSMGCFDGDQVKEIAVALENSGHRFLWSLRKPAPKGKMQFPGEYENPGEVLPEGFLERTVGIGKIIGWAPQMAVLSHPAVGGFVCHCGWNSVHESVWCNVPMAVWPLAAEQQLSAFQYVKEYGMAIEIKIDYRVGCNVIVEADKIEKAIRQLMDPESKVRVKVKEFNEKSRKAMMKGESSYNFLGSLIDDFMANIS